VVVAYNKVVPVEVVRSGQALDTIDRIYNGLDMWSGKVKDDSQYLRLSY
jgi:hypothetical protein